MSGCAQLPGYSSSGSSALVDTAAAAFSKPKDVTLTAQQIAEFPYATAYLTYGDNPRAQTVLAFAHEGRHVYTTSEGRLLTFQRGRLLGTEGFPVDFQQRASRLPDPAEAAAVQVCWRGQRDVSGEVAATAQPVSACMTPAGLETVTLAFGTRQLLRIDEDMLWVRADRHHVSHFWLDPRTREVLLSEQVIAPGQPVLRWEVLKSPHAELDIMREAVPQQARTDVFDRLEQAPPPPDLPEGQIWLSVRAPAGQSWLAETGRAVPATLQDVLQPYQWATAHWPSCQLFDIGPDPQLAAEREQALAQVDALLALRRQQGRHDLIGATLRLRDQVANWRLAHRVPLAGSPAWVSMRPERNLRLRGRQYVLLLSAMPQARPPLYLQALTADLPAVLAGQSTAHLAHQLQQLYQNQY